MRLHFYFMYNVGIQLQDNDGLPGCHYCVVWCVHETGLPAARAASLLGGLAAPQ